MYYQAETHRSRTVAGADEAARLIHLGEALTCEALIWTANGRHLAAVADGGINQPWKEVAVVRMDTDPPTQIESITFGWIDDLETKVRHLRTCETTDFRMGPTALPLDGRGEDTPAHFTCGCCGQSFESTVTQQRPFDQDAGYGICPPCVNWK